MSEFTYEEVNMLLVMKKKLLIEEFLEDLKSLLVGEWLDVYVKVKIEKWENKLTSS
jgi:hypothetical protein